jgi:hypothetical protein
VSVIEHEALPFKVHEAGAVVPFCASLHVTVPVAGTRSPESTLLTVAVHVVPMFTGSGFAAQLNATVVGLKVTTTSGAVLAIAR